MRAPIRHLEVNPEEASRYLAFVLGWAGGEIPVYVNESYAPSFWHPCGPGAGGTLWKRAESLDLHRSAQVEIGIPTGPKGSTVLWAWVPAAEARRAARFRPEPSMVLRFGAGGERLCIWGLQETVPWGVLERHNERLSHAFHSPRTRCESTELRIPLPGTFLRVGRKRPVPILVTRMQLTEYARSQVTSTLRDAPPRDAWRERRAS